MTLTSDIGCVCVFGGSGFLGLEIVKRLAAGGMTIHVADRLPDKFRIPQGPGAEHIRTIYADVRDESSVALAIEGSDSVVNAVGLYHERGAQTFEAIHELGALNVAHQAATFGIKRLIHISGIGADLRSPSSYVRSRAKGELLVHDVFDEATILAPSVMFGPSDKFLNTFAALTKFSPIMPLFGKGKTRLQPVYVNDVAAAVFQALKQPETSGKTFELGGPQVYTYRALIEKVLKQSKRRRLLVPMPFGYWSLLTRVFKFLPTPLVTPGQVELMKNDNVVSKSALSLRDLGVVPTPLEDILPKYKFNKL